MPPKLRRGNREGTIYQRQDGRWEAALPGLGGKRKRFYGRTREEVARRLAVALRDQQLGLAPTDDRTTVTAFLERWLEEVVRPTRRPKTYAGYEQLVRLHIGPEIGKVKLTALTAAQVNELLNRKLAEGLAPRTVLYMRAVLRAGVQRAMKWGLVHRNVAALTDPPRREHHEVTPFTPEELETFQKAIRGDRLEALYLLAVSTGLRQGEVLGLEWSDVDLDGAQLRVRQQLQRVPKGGLQLAPVKSETSRRSVDLPTITVEALRAYRKRQHAERLLRGPEWHVTDLVFTTDLGAAIDGSNLTRRFKGLLADAGLPRMRFHDLRHAAASFLLLQGVQLEVVSKILGHSSVQITSDLYEHLLPAVRRDAARRMDSLLKGRPRLRVVSGRQSK